MLGRYRNRQPIHDGNTRDDSTAKPSHRAFQIDVGDREQTAFLLDDFHRAENRHLVDEAYLESVLEHYGELVGSERSLWWRVR